MRVTNFIARSLRINKTEEFDRWLRNLRDQVAKRAINTRISRIAVSNFGDSKSVGEGVMELRIHVGPGYRIYQHPAESPIQCVAKRNIGWGWIAGRASARNLLSLDVSFDCLNRSAVANGDGTVAVRPKTIAPKIGHNLLSVFLANRPAGSCFDSVHKIPNRVARRNRYQNVNMISFAGKLENLYFQSVKNAVQDFLYSSHHGS